MARAKDTVGPAASRQPEIAAPVSSNGRAGRGSDFVQSLERGLAVIKAFDSTNPELTLSEVAREAGLTRAAARRFLLTLIDLGYVRVEGRLFALRPRVLELGYAYLSSLTLPELAQPHMEELVARIHESCSVSVLDGNEVVYVARVPTHRIMRVAISVGTRFPAFATSMGRVLLAALPRRRPRRIFRRRPSGSTRPARSPIRSSCTHCSPKFVPRGTASSTRNSKRACAHSPSPSATARAG